MANKFNDEIVIREITDDVSYDTMSTVMKQSHEAAKKDGIRFSSSGMNGAELKAEIEGNGQCFIAEKDGKAVGTISYTNEQRKLWYESPARKAAHIRHIAVIPEYQGQGIAGRLMKHTIDQISKTTASLIISNTPYNNKASINLHKKMGFEVSEVFYYNNQIICRMFYWLNEKEKISNWKIKSHYAKTLIKIRIKNCLKRK